MFEEIKDNSIILSGVRYLYISLQNMSHAIEQLGRESRIYACGKKMSFNLAVYFKNSLLGELILLPETNNVHILNNSKFCCVIANLMAKAKVYSRSTSKVLQAKYLLAEGFSSSPVRIVSLILIISIAVNSSLLLIFRNTISPANWLLHAIFFTLGLIGLSMDVGLKTLKGNSQFLKIILKKQ